MNKSNRLNLKAVMIALTIVAFLSYFFSFLAIDNRTPGYAGVEIPTNGFSFVFATLFNGFVSPAKIFGNVSFYYYWEKSATTVIGILSTISFFFIITGIVLLAVAFLKKKKIVLLQYLASLFLLLSFLNLLFCFGTCIYMLPKFMVKYQCNSFCHPMYFCIIPALFSLSAGIVGICDVLKRKAD